MNSPAQTLLTRLAALAVFAAGLGLSASRLFVGIGSGEIAGPGRVYGLMEEPIGFVLVVAAWTAVGLTCFVGCVAFLWAILARPRFDREAARRARRYDLD